MRPLVHSAARLPFTALSADCLSGTSVRSSADRRPGFDWALDLRQIQATIAEDDDGLRLMLADGQTAIEIVCGLPGPTTTAILGAQRLLTVVSRFADAMRGSVD